MQSMASHFASGVGGALSLAFIAFSTVFLVLGALTLIITGVKYLSMIGEKKNQAPAAPKAAAPAAAPKAAAPAPVSAPAGGDQGKVIAAIAGAILACGGGMQVKSIRPLGKAGIQPGSLWKQAALMEGLKKLDRNHWKK